METQTSYTFLHGLLGTNINWKHQLQNVLGEGEAIYTPSIDYFQNPKDVRAFVVQKLNDILTKEPDANHVLIANSVGCHFGLDFVNSFSQSFFISPTYRFDRGVISRSKSSISSEVKKLFFDSAILEKHTSVLECETLYISKKLKRLSSIKALKTLKEELSSVDYEAIYRAHRSKIHIILGAEDPLIPVNEYILEQEKNKVGVSIDVIENCSHVAPVERPNELRAILKKYGV